MTNQLSELTPEDRIIKAIDGVSTVIFISTIIQLVMILVTLRLTNLISLSWWLIFFPLYGPSVFAFVNAFIKSFNKARRANREG